MPEPESSLGQILQRAWREHRLDLQSGMKQLFFEHQSHQPASGHHQLWRRAPEHLEVLVARWNVDTALRLQELLSARLLADPHALRGVHGLALHVVDGTEPAR